ncbi:ABC transporter ATP-binding protein [Acidipropionibacterium jensenii]|uniref:ABC transporter ATP-binding protein n=1 Tax=Acidipropionibacterium jensenii TaxID=1749 RepID=UPI000BC2D206|nr:ABC transporter ATP-binding protein [Acidipropionibacterium jensenii]AZZ41449.1 ABC transporter ATP-binding protein [Acidipropionibacterium jensenii]
MTTSPAVSIDGLCVDRGGRPVLDHLDLDIPTCRVTGLLGPSGAGKSTLMRAIVGVQVVASGSVTVLGSPAGSPSLRRRVGYVTQAPSIYDDLSVESNVRYFARLFGTGRRRADEVIEQVDLAAERHKLSGRLSGGQLSRVSLACALVADPDLLVLDEPTVGLDPVLRRSLWALFDELAAGGATLLVSSHVMDEAARCDELVLMRDGRVLAHEGLDSLLRRTGTTDAEAAFLALIDDPGDGSGATGGRPPRHAEGGVPGSRDEQDSSGAQDKGARS